MNQDRNERALRNFYEFDDNDLETNRQGRLSEKQLKVINSVSNTRKMLGYAIGGFVAVVGLLVLGVVALAVILSLIAQTWNQGAIIGILSGCIGTIALVCVGGYFMWLLFKKGNAKYVLRTAQGPIHLKVVHLSTKNRSYQQHQMQIGNALFVLDDELVGRIHEGESYTVYYLDYQDGSEGIIQSLEKL